MRQKTSVFRFWCSWRFADFPLFSIRFSVFAENANGFSDLISNAGFGFSSLASVGSEFSLIWAAIAHLNWSRIAAERKCYWEECVTNQLKYRKGVHASWMTLKTLTLQCGALRSRSVCEPCLPTYQTCQNGRRSRTSISDCGLCRVFWRRGERRREFQKENQV